MRQPRNHKRLRLAVIISMLLHLVLLWFLTSLDVPKPAKQASKSIEIDLSDDLPIPEPEVPPDPLQPEQEQRQIPVSGQVVELPDPEVVEEPDEAQYLASKSRKVEEETRAERFKINPEELAPEYNEDAPQELAPEAPQDVVENPEDKKEPEPELDNDPLPEAEFALYPDRFSRWASIDQGSSEAPRTTTRAAQERRGAPQNDFLNEKLGQATLLNTREFLYADYFNKIRRLVNFYWSQNLDNINGSDIGQPLRRPSYNTSVLPTLDAQGHLVSVKLLKGCGVTAFDKAVIDAWSAASPFPEPPEGLVVGGRAELIRFDFHLELGRATNQYTAIDPRANVRFPGIAWPR